MTAAKTAAPYRSGMCAHNRHDHCRGDFGTAVCDCGCHQEPAVPEPEPEVLPLLLARHCPTCCCQGHA